MGTVSTIPKMKGMNAGTKFEFRTVASMMTRMSWMRRQRRRVSMKFLEFRLWFS
jgi:hypothetical protein